MSKREKGLGSKDEIRYREEGRRKRIGKEGVDYRMGFNSQAEK